MIGLALSAAKDALVTGMAAFTLFERLRPSPGPAEPWGLEVPLQRRPIRREVARPPVGWWLVAGPAERAAMAAAIAEALGRRGSPVTRVAKKIRGLRLELVEARRARDAYAVLALEGRLQHLRALARKCLAK